MSFIQASNGSPAVVELATQTNAPRGFAAADTPFPAPTAVEMAAWRRAYLPVETADAGDTRRLRRLFRAVYSDAPDLRHVLALLAERHARLFSPGADADLARETLAVYVPVAAMLGLYRLRRGWIEESVRLLWPDEYTRKATEMGIALAGPTSLGLYDDVAAYYHAWHGPTADSALPAAGKTMTLDDRCRLFDRLRADLLIGLRAEFHPASPPQVELIPALPGSALDRKRRPPSPGERPPQLTVRVLCANHAACYRALGVVHNVTGFRSAGFRPDAAPRFHDYIARPKYNGYRALQTVCLWSPSDKKSGSWLVKFHILTATMHTVNESGLLAAPPPGPPAGWWARPAAPAPRANPDDPPATLHDFVRAHDLGSHNDTDAIYCFTPEGEIRLLPAGSTALDFAYHVHTELGNQAARIEVNGRTVLLDAPLNNGDLVHVTYDPLVARLDFSWLGLAQTRRARTEIRAALRARARLVHPGRRPFEKVLIHLLDTYAQDYARRRKPAIYVPPIPTSDEIERYLQRAALRLGLAHREELNDMMAADDRLTHDLAHRLLAEHIIRDLRTPAGKPWRADLSGIDLCPACRPTPVDAPLRGQVHHLPGQMRRLHGRVRRLLEAPRLFEPPHNDMTMLTLHVAGCNYISPQVETIDLQWADDDTPDRWPVYRFSVEMPDRRGLLDTLLEMAYQLPHTYLFHVVAGVHEGRAIIDLDVAAKQPQLCRDLKTLIETMGPETRVAFHLLLSDPRSNVRAAELARAVNIPFTESEVSDDWRFVGREETLGAVVAWLRAPAAPPTLLLHGRRRVGKSSVTRRLMDKGYLDDLRPPVTAAFVDLRAASIRRPESVAVLLAQQVCAAVGILPPHLERWADPMVWLNGLLGQAERLCDANGRRLLIIVDEFDADLEDVSRLGRQTSGRQPSVLTKLRALQRTHPRIRWLLVVQTAFLADAAFQWALPAVAQDVPRLAVSNLTAPYARQLIEMLSAEQGFSFAAPWPGEDDIPAQIVFWTAGDPYFIHVICRALLERANRNRRRTVNQGDLILVLNQVLNRGNLSHFIEPLEADPNRALIADCLAGRAPLGGRLPWDDLAADLVACGCALSEHALSAHVLYLEQIGVLALRREGGRISAVALAMPLLQQAISNKHSSSA